MIFNLNPNNSHFYDQRMPRKAEMISKLKFKSEDVEEYDTEEYLKLFNSPVKYEPSEIPSLRSKVELKF